MDLMNMPAIARESVARRDLNILRAHISIILCQQEIFLSQTEEISINIWNRLSVILSIRRG